MAVSVTSSIDIAAPLDEVFRWVSDDAYTTLWDGTTISRGSGYTIRRRGADLAQFSERRLSEPPLMFAVELDLEGQHERIQFDLAPLYNATRLTVTASALNPSAQLQANASKNAAKLREMLFAELEQVKALAEHGRIPTPATEITDKGVRRRLSRMSEHGRKLWETASPNARLRAVFAVSSGTNATNHAEAQMAVEYAGALMQDFTAKAYAKVACLATLSAALLVYAVIDSRPILGAVSIGFLFMDARGVLARRKVSDTVTRAYQSNLEFLEQSQRVEHAIAQLSGADTHHLTTLVDELAAVNCTNSLNRRIEVALERIAAVSDPSAAQRAAAALSWRHQRIGAEVMQRAA